MKKLGIELEFTGVTRKQVVTALENLFETEAEEVTSKSASDGYKYHRIKDNNGDTWLVVRDRSIKPQRYSSENRFDVVDLIQSATKYMVELVTPALTPKSLPLLFTIVDIIKAIGGIVNSSCGLHIHIDKPDNVDDIITLFNRFCNEQFYILNKFNVPKWRLSNYCQPYDDFKEVNCTYSSQEAFVDYLVTKYATRDDKEFLDPRSIRYHALNFYSLKEHGTVEFRLFNSTLDRVEIANIIDWVIHFVYTAEDYNCYVPVLGSIITNEIR